MCGMVGYIGKENESKTLMIKSNGKNRRNEFLDVKMFIQKLKKGRGIIQRR